MPVVTRPYDSDALNDLIERFRQQFGSFDTPEYINEEREYKLSAVIRFEQLLGKERFKQMLDEGRFEEIKMEMKRAVAKDKNNPLFNLLNAFDTQVIRNNDAEALARNLYNLLYGEEDFNSRFNQWLNVLQRINPRCWPAATIYLMLANPQEHIFVKPTPFREFLEAVDSPLVWETRPTVKSYTELQKLARELLTKLAPLGAKDMIDVQSFIWIMQSEEVSDSEEEEIDLVTDTPISLSEWQAAVQTTHPLSKQLVTEYPVWLAQTFGGLVEFFPRDGQTFSLRIANLAQLFGTFNKEDALRIRIYEPNPELLELLRQGLSKPEELKPLKLYGKVGYRFKIYTQDDYRLLQTITRRLVGKADPVWPPQELSGSAFVLMFRNEPESRSYRFYRGAGGAAVQLYDAVKRFQADGTPVYLIIYRPGPLYSFTAWAQVKEPLVLEGDKDWQLSLDWHDFPEPQNLNDNAYSLRSKINWLSEGLRKAFFQKSIRRISLEQFQIIVNTARSGQIIEPDEVEPLPSEPQLPDTWQTLRQYLDFVLSLEKRSYTPEELLVAARQLDFNLPAQIEAENFVVHLRQFRLLRSVASGSGYQVADYVQKDDETALLRLMALGLLIPSENTATETDLIARVILPRLRVATTENQTIANFAPELGSAESDKLLNWYTEAGITTITDGKWQTTPDGLATLSGDSSAITRYNQFLLTLLTEKEQTSSLPPLSGRLPRVTDLDTRLKKLSEQLLIDGLTVKRIYRSLIAGRHVILSGPPGTGKTQLAQKLPELLWREQQPVYRLTLELDKPPVESQLEERHGYHVNIVTATDNWSVSDVVGGIGPEIRSDNGIGYRMKYGVLTRAILQNYRDTEEGERIPTDLVNLQRKEFIAPNQRTYRGVWLVIDEFNRAPIDAALGGLLTTLSGGEKAKLAVETADYGSVEISLPEDFRIIGTLNSFDRFFLNQISEALKRRFDFIDVMPPARALAKFEQGIAAKNALKRLDSIEFSEVSYNVNSGIVSWQGVLEIVPDKDTNRPLISEIVSPEAKNAISSFWRIFEAIRVFRKLGTAQAEAVFSNLFTGVLIGLKWQTALDTALADVLADQLQLVLPIERQVLELYLEHASDADAFNSALENMLKTSPRSRFALLKVLHQADQELHGQSDIEFSGSNAKVSSTQLSRLFEFGAGLDLPKPSHFQQRLRQLGAEGGV